MVSLIVLSRLQFHDKHCTHLSVWCIEYVKLMYLNGGLFSVKYPSRNAYEGYSSSSERKAWLIQIYFLTLSWFKQLKIKLKHSCLCLENLKREICILISWSQLLDRLVNEPVNFKNPGYTSANSAALALHSHIGQDLLFINNILRFTKWSSWNQILIYKILSLSPPLFLQSLELKAVCRCFVVGCHRTRRPAKRNGQCKRLWIG